MADEDKMSKHNNYIVDYLNKGYHANGVLSVLKSFGYSTHSKRLPDFWKIENGMIEWHEVVSTCDISEDKMKWLYWLKDWIDDIDIGLDIKFFKHDLVISSINEFDPYEIVYNK